jgi:curved DNA-binding protein CbpA
MRDPYAILGLSRSFTDVELRDAWRRMVREHHPDLGGSRERFEEARAAYEVLADPARRRQLDGGDFDFDSFVDEVRAGLRDSMPELSSVLDDLQRVRGRGQPSIHERSDAAGRLIFRGISLFSRLRSRRNEP